MRACLRHRRSIILKEMDEADRKKTPAGSECTALQGLLSDIIIITEYLIFQPFPLYPPARGNTVPRRYEPCVRRTYKYGTDRYRRR